MWLLVMLIDGSDMEHLPHRNDDVYRAVSNWLMERMESWNIDVQRGLTIYSCETLTSQWLLTVTLLSSSSSMNIGCQRFFIVFNLVQSLHRWWDALELRTHAAGVVTAANALALSSSQIKLQSPAVSSAGDTMPLLTLLHASQLHLMWTQSA